MFVEIYCFFACSCDTQIIYSIYLYIYVYKKGSDTYLCTRTDNFPFPLHLLVSQLYTFWRGSSDLIEFISKYIAEFSFTFTYAVRQSSSYEHPTYKQTSVLLFAIRHALLFTVYLLLCYRF